MSGYTQIKEQKSFIFLIDKVLKVWNIQRGGRGLFVFTKTTYKYPLIQIYTIFITLPLVYSV